MYVYIGELLSKYTMAELNCIILVEHSWISYYSKKLIILFWLSVIELFIVVKKCSNCTICKICWVIASLFVCCKIYGWKRGKMGLTFVKKSAFLSLCVKKSYHRLSFLESVTCDPGDYNPILTQLHKHKSGGWVTRNNQYSKTTMKRHFQFFKNTYGVIKKTQ